MKLHLTAIATGLALLMLQPVQAGGPVIIEDAYEAEPQRNRNGWIVPVVGLLIIAAIAASNGSCYGDPTPDPEPPTGGC